MTGVSTARLTRLREAMAAEGLDAFLVRDTSNIRWLTAFDGVFDDERAHALLVTPQRAVLHTDSRYAAACERAAEANGSVVEIDASRVSHAAFVASVLTDGALGIEDDIALREYRALEKELAGIAKGEGLRQPCHSERSEAKPSELEESRAAPADDVAVVRLLETRDFVLSLRAVKDASEIARLQAAQAVTDAAFQHIVSFMRPGMTEREVQVELEGFMLRNGAEGVAFPSIVATGANGANPHAIPGETRLEEGQCVVLDFGAKVQGYCADMTRTVFLGQPSERMRAAYETLRQANEQVEAMLAPGVTGKQAHELAERVLEEGGFGGRMGHSLGHGVGLDVHEDPLLSPRNDAPLREGNVVTVEPGIYLPGEFGMRLEDFGVITPDGYQVFTQSTHEMVIIDRLL